jgi:hypothetical protein
MVDFHSKKADSFLSSQDLQRLLQKAKLLLAINEKLKEYIAPEIFHYCQAGNIQDGKLVILTANSSVATQIRLRTSNLLAQFRQDPLLQTVQEIQAKVRRDITATTSSKKKRQQLMPLSPETAQLVHDIAQSIEDPKLREVLERIASRTEVAE